MLYKKSAKQSEAIFTYPNLKALFKTLDIGWREGSDVLSRSLATDVWDELIKGSLGIFKHGSMDAMDILRTSVTEWYLESQRLPDVMN